MEKNAENLLCIECNEQPDQQTGTKQQKDGSSESHTKQDKEATNLANGTDPKEKKEEPKGRAVRNNRDRCRGARKKYVDAVEKVPEYGKTTNWKINQDGSIAKKVSLITKEEAQVLQAKTDIRKFLKQCEENPELLPKLPPMHLTTEKPTTDVLAGIPADSYLGREPGISEDRSFGKQSAQSEEEVFSHRSYNPGGNENAARNKEEAVRRGGYFSLPDSGGSSGIIPEGSLEEIQTKTGQKYEKNYWCRRSFANVTNNSATSKYSVQLPIKFRHRMVKLNFHVMEGGAGDFPIIMPYSLLGQHGGHIIGPDDGKISGQKQPPLLLLGNLGLSVEMIDACGIPLITLNASDKGLRVTSNIRNGVCRRTDEKLEFFFDPIPSEQTDVPAPEASGGGGRESADASVGEAVGIAFADIGKRMKTPARKKELEKKMREAKKKAAQGKRGARKAGGAKKKAPYNRKVKEPNPTEVSIERPGIDMKQHFGKFHEDETSESSESEPGKPGRPRTKTKGRSGSGWTPSKSGKKGKKNRNKAPVPESEKTLHTPNDDMSSKWGPEPSVLTKGDAGQKVELAESEVVEDNLKPIIRGPTPEERDELLVARNLLKQNRGIVIDVDESAAIDDIVVRINQYFEDVESVPPLTKKKALKLAKQHKMRGHSPKLENLPFITKRASERKFPEVFRLQGCRRCFIINDVGNKNMEAGIARPAAGPGRIRGVDTSATALGYITHFLDFGSHLNGAYLRNYKSGSNTGRNLPKFARMARCVPDILMADLGTENMDANFKPVAERLGIEVVDISNKKWQMIGKLESSHKAVKQQIAKLTRFPHSEQTIMQAILQKETMREVYSECLNTDLRNVEKANPEMFGSESGVLEMPSRILNRTPILEKTGPAPNTVRFGTDDPDRPRRVYPVRDGERHGQSIPQTTVKQAELRRVIQRVVHKRDFESYVARAPKRQNSRATFFRDSSEIAVGERVYIRAKKGREYSWSKEGTVTAIVSPHRVSVRYDSGGGAILTRIRDLKRRLVEGPHFKIKAVELPAEEIVEMIETDQDKELRFTERQVARQPVKVDTEKFNWKEREMLKNEYARFKEAGFDAPGFMLVPPEGKGTEFCHSVQCRNCEKCRTVDYETSDLRQIGFFQRRHFECTDVNRECHHMESDEFMPIPDLFRRKLLYLGNTEYQGIRRTARRKRGPRKREDPDVFHRIMKQQQYPTDRDLPYVQPQPGETTESPSGSVDTETDIMVRGETAEKTGDTQQRRHATSSKTVIPASSPAAKPQVLPQQHALTELGKSTTHKVGQKKPESTPKVGSVMNTHMRGNESNEDGHDDGSRSDESVESSQSGLSRAKQQPLKHTVNILKQNPEFREEAMTRLQQELMNELEELTHTSVSSEGEAEDPTIRQLPEDQTAILESPGIDGNSVREMSAIHSSEIYQTDGTEQEIMQLADRSAPDPSISQIPGPKSDESSKSPLTLRTGDTLQEVLREGGKRMKEKVEPRLRALGNKRQRLTEQKPEEFQENIRKRERESSSETDPAAKRQKGAGQNFFNVFSNEQNETFISDEMAAFPEEHGRAYLPPQADGGLMAVPTDGNPFSEFYQVAEAVNVLLQNSARDHGFGSTDKPSVAMTKLLNNIDSELELSVTDNAEKIRAYVTAMTIHHAPRKDGVYPVGEGVRYFLPSKETGNLQPILMATHFEVNPKIGELMKQDGESPACAEYEDLFHFSYDQQIGDQKKGTSEIDPEGVTKRKLPDNFDPAIIKGVKDLNRYGCFRTTDAFKGRDPTAKGKNVIASRFVLAIKIDLVKRRLVKAKARLVAKGFPDKRNQMDNGSSMIPDADPISFLQTAVIKQARIYSADIRAAFIQGDNYGDETKIWMRLPPEALEIPRNEVDDQSIQECVRLNKSIYGLCDAPVMRERRPHGEPEQAGFVKSRNDTSPWSLPEESETEKVRQYKAVKTAEALSAEFVSKQEIIGADGYPAFRADDAVFFGNQRFPDRITALPKKFDCEADGLGGPDTDDVGRFVGRELRMVWETNPCTGKREYSLRMCMPTYAQKLKYLPRRDTVGYFETRARLRLPKNKFFLRRRKNPLRGRLGEPNRLSKTGIEILASVCQPSEKGVRSGEPGVDNIDGLLPEILRMNELIKHVKDRAERGILLRRFDPYRNETNGKMNDKHSYKPLIRADASGTNRSGAVYTLVGSNNPDTKPRRSIPDPVKGAELNKTSAAERRSKVHFYPNSAMNVLGWVSTKPNRRYSSATGSGPVAMRMATSHGLNIINTLRFPGILDEHETVRAVTGARNVPASTDPVRKPAGQNSAADYRILNGPVRAEPVGVRRAGGYADPADLLTKAPDKSAFEYRQDFSGNETMPVRVGVLVGFRNLIRPGAKIQ